MAPLASPATFQYCQRARPRSVCLNLACVGDPSVKEATYYADAIGLLSGTVAGREARLSAAYARRGMRFEGFSRIQVEARTLDDILREHLPAHTPIDFVSIDVEGAELDVLRGFDLRQHQPRVVIAEANTRASAKALSDYLATSGYRQARQTPYNVLYARQRRDIRHLRRTTIDCTTEAAMHPCGPSFALPDGFGAKTIHARPSDMLLRRIRKALRRMAVAMRFGK
jgi:FkbM family methyltransferase